MTTIQPTQRSNKRIIIVACAVGLLGTGIVVAYATTEEKAGEIAAPPVPEREPTTLVAEPVAVESPKDEVAEDPPAPPQPAPSEPEKSEPRTILGPVVSHEPVSGASSPSAPSTNTHATAPTPRLTSATPAQRSAIVSAIERANRAETKALRTLDAAPLQATHTGKALNMLKETVKTLSGRGLYMANTLVRADVGAISVSSDGRKAQVRTTEIWASSYYDKAHNCRAHEHERPMPQTLFLSRVDQNWVIADVKHDRKDPPTVTKCHS